MNVSSIVVKTSLEHMQDVMDNINKMDDCEVHFYDAEGKIVVTIEGKDIDEQMKNLKQIQGIPFVYSANLAYSYCEEEITGALRDIIGSGRSSSID